MRPFFVFFFILFSSFQAFSQKNPPIRSRELLKKAEQLYDSGDYKKSMSIYDQIDWNDSNYTKSLYGRVLDYQADSQFNMAIELCEEALKLRDQRETEPDIYNTYGNLFTNTKQNEKAISVFNEAIRKYPSFSLLYFNKGVSLFEQERYADAESVFKEALLINPYIYSAHFYLGLCAINEGKIVPAFLSFTGYLLVNPEGKYNKRCINILAAIAGGKDEILEYKAKRREEGDENYTLVEDILLSKIALEKEYKIKVSLDDPIFRQIQVVLEKLEYKEEDSDFWMQYYVPYFKKLFNEEQFEPFIFWSFGNVQIKEIQDFNRKNKKIIDHFVAQSAGYFNEIRATRMLAYNKRAEQRIRYLYSDGELQGKGELMGDGKNFQGSWTFYYPTGNIKTSGQYNESGKEGIWTYYGFSGNLKAREIYRNGKLEGKQQYFSEQGLLTNDEQYLNGQETGLESAYWINGQLFSTTHYKSGKKEGEYKEYSSGGQLIAVSQFVNNVLSGSFVTYYNSGQSKESGNYLNGLLDGPYKNFHENGQLSSEGVFKNGMNEGEWKTYYDNGKIKSRVLYVNTKPEGIQEEYYEDGELKTTYNYKKGLLNGESVSYDKDKKPYARFQFSNDKLESAVYFDKEGKQISSSERKNNGLVLEIFLPDGTKITQRPLNENGQISGQETSYYSSGQISQVIQYLNGEKNGSSTEYFLNGRKKSEQTIKNGKEDGRFTSFFPNGRIESEGWMEDGKSSGTWNYYNERGRLISTQYMVDGILHGYKTAYYPNGQKSIEKKFYKGWLEEMKQFDSTGKLLVCDSFPQFTGKFLLLYPDGHKMQECNYVKGVFEGPLTQYFFDGSMEFIQYYKGGLLDSSYTAYDYNQNKIAEGRYKADKKTGLWKFYNEDGRLESTETYANDELYGPSQFYGYDNKIRGEIMYRHDERNGISTNSDPDGSLLYNVLYDEGNLKSYSYLNKDGKPAPEIKAEHGKLTILSFFQNGKPSRQCQFIENKMHGSDILYYTNGKLRSQDSFEYGIFEGASKQYYSNGNLSKIYTYENGILQGPCLVYNDKGVLTREINYDNGNRHGESKYYTENGTLLETRYYYDGILLSVKK
jgi:antitoxin component YwqK of YwqJK toxin-antitoxin module/Tfp pilus assembly protein PilF